MVISEANGSTENGQERAIEYSDLPAVAPTHRCCVAHAINETDDEWKPRRIDDRSHHGSTISIGSLGRGTTRIDEVRHFFPRGVKLPFRCCTNSSSSPALSMSARCAVRYSIGMVIPNYGEGPAGSFP